MRIKAIVALTCVLSLSAFGQSTEAIEATINLTNMSPSDAPLTFTGTIKCSEWVDGAQLRSSGKGAVHVVNPPQQVVAWIAIITTNCLHSGPQNTVAIADHFFSDHNLPEKNIDVSFDDGLKSSEDGKIKDPIDWLHSPATTPIFTVELKFVQFDDSTTWGSKDVATQITDERKTVQTFLEGLSTASTSDSVFLAALGTNQTDSRLQDVSTELQTLQQSSGTAAAIAKVKQCLRAAALRKVGGF